ncbi:MAG: response regulator [Elusimicrobia bacterium]|nr:response regulator [Elusimicrobiota bacterium]
MPKLLIVDDEQTIRALFEYVFADAGYTVETAINGIDALAKLASFTPDVMLVDIAMPEMDGKEFILNFKKLALSRPELKQIPFFIMTGENFMNASFDGVFKGNDDFYGFIPKMTSPEEVLELVQKTLKDLRAL